MTWYIWVIVFDLATSAIWKVWQAGTKQHRPPVTGREAVLGLIIYSLYIWAIVTSVS